MPTENRSSNEQKMVSVPRELTREMLNGVCMHPDLARSLWSALLKNAPQPAAQHQGEPVALKCWNCNADFTLKERADCDGCCWECGVEIDLDDYAEKFAGEVERLRKENELLRHDVGSFLETAAETCDLLGIDIQAAQSADGKPSDVLFKHAQALRTQVAEQQALIQRIRSVQRSRLDAGDGPGLYEDPDDDGGYVRWERIEEALRASAEPSAPVPLCNICKGYGKYQDGDSGTDEDGRAPNIVECECDDSERMPQYRASAPVERDERAEFEAWCAAIGYTLKHSEHGNGFKPGYGSELFSSWQARAALERKSR